MNSANKNDIAANTKADKVTLGHAQTFEGVEGGSVVTSAGVVGVVD